MNESNNNVEQDNHDNNDGDSRRRWSQAISMTGYHAVPPSNFRMPSKKESIVWLGSKEVWQRCQLRLLPYEQNELTGVDEESGLLMTKPPSVKWPYQLEPNQTMVQCPDEYSNKTISEVIHHEQEIHNSRSTGELVGGVHGIWIKKSTGEIIRVFLSWLGIDPSALRSWRPGWYDWSIMSTETRHLVGCMLLDGEYVADNEEVAKSFKNHFAGDTSFWRKYFEEEGIRNSFKDSGWLNCPHHRFAHKDGHMHDTDDEDDDSKSVDYEGYPCFHGWRFAVNTPWMTDEFSGPLQHGDA